VPSQSGENGPYETHNLKVIGSNPIPATSFVISRCPSRTNRWDGFSFMGKARSTEQGTKSLPDNLLFELGKTSNPTRRAERLAVFEQVNPAVELTSSFAFDIEGAGWDEAYWNDGSGNYEKMLDRLRELDRNKKRSPVRLNQERPNCRDCDQEWSNFG
jgi:hypothetical protein